MYFETGSLYGLQPPRNDGALPYPDESAMLKDMADIRYGRDAVFTKAVEARIGAGLQKEQAEARQAVTAIEDRAAKAVPFSGPEEMAAAVNDPRYAPGLAHDPVYAKQVQARILARSVQEERRQAMSQSTQAVSPSPVAPVGPQPFASQYEMIQAMSSERYRRDSAYRAEIATRVDLTIPNGE